MANGLDFEPTWWQAALGSIAALLAGWAGGQKRGRRSTLEEDSAVTAVSLEAHRSENAEAHEETRRAIVDALNTIRIEGKENRKAIYDLGAAISSQVSALHRDVIDRTGRGGRREGD